MAADAHSQTYSLPARFYLREKKLVDDRTPTGKWSQIADEVWSRQEIDGAIGETKKTSIDDSKNLQDQKPSPQKKKGYYKINAANTSYKTVLFIGEVSAISRRYYQ